MAAKIYRINYKSDFILTLTSDAGWTTPFCIKFWTGAPAMAYYAGWDGETYTHCAYDPAEPTKLVVQFDDHHLPVGDLKFQIGYHFTVADFPNDTEDEVINPANITVEIDGEEYQVMLDFTGETAPEIEFALPAYANEQQRIANEQQRIANEQQRITAEEQRVEEFGVIEEQAQQAISEAGSAAQAAYEAAGEAANVNAELDGTILTITNRQGTSTSVNTKGEQGEQGNPGQAATITVGTTTTGAPGTNAQVTNSGTSSAAVLDFTIPQGAKGDKGDQGEPGEVTEAELTEKLATKANTDGYYSRMIVGGAESVIGKENDLDAATDYVVQGATGIAKVNEVMGRSEKWNQIWEKGTILSGNGSSVIYDSLTDTYNINHDAGQYYFSVYNYSQRYVAGHKYWVNAKFTSTGLNYVRVKISDANGQNIEPTKQYLSQILIIPTTASTVSLSQFMIFGFGTTDVAATLSIQNLVVSDLTDIYGEGNEPTTVEQFEADVFAKYGKTLDEYFEYDAGSINNANVESLEVYDDNNTLRTTLPINIKTITGKVNGEGESVTIFPNGMRGVGSVYDSLIVDEDGWARRTIVRMASRAYQEGDESDTSVLTDGTTTIYSHETPIEYVLDEPILMTFNAYNGGVIRQIKGDMELATRMNIAFALNVEGFVNGASKEYINAASMQDFLSVLGTQTGGTWSMTWSEIDKKYIYVFTPNSYTNETYNNN